jgi:GAF domain-containing protein
MIIPQTEREPDPPVSVVEVTEGSPTMTVDNEASLAELAAWDHLQPPIWPKLPPTLAELCLCLTEVVPSAESAGVVIFPSDSPRSGQRPTLNPAEMIGAAPAGAAILQMERQLDEGPVLTACGSQSIVSSGDLSADGRWPRFGPAVAELELHSVVAVPLPGVGNVITGVLSLYSHQRDAFDARTIHLIAAVADVVRNALVSAEMLEQTRRAFEAISRTWDRSRIVNQAVGVLIRSNCTEEQARLRLARMASHRNEDVAVSAQLIVDEARREAHLSSIAPPHPPRYARP